MWFEEKFFIMFLFFQLKSVNHNMDVMIHSPLFLFQTKTLLREHQLHLLLCCEQCFLQDQITVIKILVEICMQT